MKFVTVIDCLRRNYPDVRWRWHRKQRCWNGSDGSVVRAVAALASRYDGDDDNFRTEYWRYFNDGRIPERVDLLRFMWPAPDTKGEGANNE